MNESEYSEDKLISALKDIGMNMLIISEFINDINLGHYEKTKKILSKQRTKLLSNLHADQDKLYCLDYLANQLKKAEELKFKKDKEKGEHL